MSKMACKDCGTVAEPGQVTPGHFAVEVAVFGIQNTRRLPGGARQSGLTRAARTGQHS